MLRLKSPMMHGPAVVRLQELLEDNNFNAGDHDGIYGPDTELAVKRFQASRYIEPDGIVGPITWAKFDESDHGLENAELISIIGEHPRPRLYGRPRSWDEISGVTLHQTGCKMPADPLKWGRLNAHYGITSGGVVVEVNAPTDMIWHAQKISRRTIGIEIAGNFEGVQGDPDTLWRGGGPAARLTPAMIDASDRLFDYLLGLFQANGRTWEHVYAHRQSAASRRADPGSEIWSEIAERWIDMLCVDVDREFHTPKGRPIPIEWSDDGEGSF